MKYWAYLSYSHKDARVSQRLHRALERFPIPQALRKQFPGSLEETHLRPVFRDRDDLHSASNLGKALEEALDASSALIVLCSPDAARSRWVNEEIRHFVQTDRRDRIFALIIDGIPGSGDEHECFPEALRLQSGLDIEPLAADARRGKDGWHDAILKICAGVLNVSYDTLKRRAHRAQQRRLMLATAGAFTVAVGASLLATYALQQKKIADARRSQAEELVSFMLGDLRHKLAELGRLDVLDAVGEQAGRYFLTVPFGDLSDHDLEEQARATRQLGEVRLNQGDFEAAAAHFESSIVRWEQLLQRDADNPTRMFELGQAQFWVGYVMWQAGNSSGAFDRFIEYLNTSKTLLRLFPASPQYKLELLFAYSNLGTLVIESGDTQTATGYFRLAESVGEELLEWDPDNRQYLMEQAATVSWLSRLAAENWNLRDAVVEQLRSNAMLAKLLESGDASFIERELYGESCQVLAVLYWQIGVMDATAKHSRCADDVFAMLTEHDPENDHWRQRLLGVRVHQLRWRWARGDDAEALYSEIRNGLDEAMSDSSRTRALERLYTTYYATATLAGRQTPADSAALWRGDIEANRDELTARCYLEASLALSAQDLPEDSFCLAHASPDMGIEAAAWLRLLVSQIGGSALPAGLEARLDRSDFAQSDYLKWLSSVSVRRTHLPFSGRSTEDGVHLTDRWTPRWIAYPSRAGATAPN